MHYQNSISFHRESSVSYFAYPCVCWSCFMQANAPGDAAACAAAQPKMGEVKRKLCTVDEKWCFYQLIQREPDLALSAYMSKFNAQHPNPLASWNASDWIQRERIDKLNKLCAVNIVKRVRDKYVRSHPVEFEKLEKALVPRPGGHGFAFEAMLDAVIYVSSALLTVC